MTEKSTFDKLVGDAKELLDEIRVLRVGPDSSREQTDFVLRLQGKYEDLIISLVTLRDERSDVEEKLGSLKSKYNAKYPEWIDKFRRKHDLENKVRPVVSSRLLDNYILAEDPELEEDSRGDLTVFAELFGLRRLLPESAPVSMVTLDFEDEKDGDRMARVAEFSGRNVVLGVQIQDFITRFFGDLNFLFNEESLREFRYNLTIRSLLDLDDEIHFATEDFGLVQKSVLAAQDRFQASVLAQISNKDILVTYLTTDEVERLRTLHHKFGLDIPAPIKINGRNIHVEFEVS